MRRSRLLLVLVAVLAVAPAASAAARFSLGVAAGEVSASSAVLWGHATRTGRVTLEVARDGRFRHLVLRRRVRATAAADRTLSVPVSHLRAGRRYWFRFIAGTSRSARGTFTTAPARSRTRTIRFAVTGDADAQPTPGQIRPFWNGFEVYKRMTDEHNSFNVNLGDTIYSDSEVPGTWPSTPDALTVAQKRAKYKLNLGQPHLQGLRASAALYSHWDDHEFINDFTRFETQYSAGTDAEKNRRTLPYDPAAVYRAGVQAFREYAPVRIGRSGLYRSFRWGRNLEAFFLDERSFRSAKASANHTCDNAQTGEPDLAPTVPTPKRNLLALAVPSLRQPVRPQCLAALDDATRTFLGKQQYDTFTAAIKRSSATFKVVFNETPIQQLYALPYDRWEGYEAERQRLIAFLRDNVKNVVFLTTDTHANLIASVRSRTLEDGGPLESGFSEVVTGPAATATFGREIDGATGRAGIGTLVALALFKPQPPTGLGMTCAAVDVFSYAEVAVTNSKLTVTPKDFDGMPVKDVNGQPCPPLVIDER